MIIFAMVLYLNNRVGRSERDSTRPHVDPNTCSSLGI